MQSLIDVKSLGFLQAIVPVSESGNTNGPGLDMQLYGQHTGVEINNGVVTGSAIWTVQMQSSPDNSTWTNEPDANALSGQITAAGITKLAYQRTQRYARAVLTLVSGTSSLIAVTVIAQPKYEPSNAGFDLAPTSIT